MSSENNPTSISRSGRLLINCAAFVVITAGIRAANSLFVPFLLSLFIAIICLSPYLWLQKRRVPTGVALLLVILGILAIGSTIGTVVGASVNSFANNLPGYSAILKKKTFLVIEWMNSIGIKLPSVPLTETLGLDEPLQLIGGFLGALGKVLSNTVLIILTVVFILLEASSFPAKLQIAFKSPETSLNNFDKVHENIKRYMALKTLVSLGTGFFVAIWLLILGIDYPLLWGLMAFLLNYIPNIGSIIAAVPAVLLGLIQYGFGSALLVTGGYLVVNFVFGNMLEPRLMGRGLGLSTLVVFLSLVFWGWVLGPVGMLLSVPLTMTAKIALDSNEDTRWLAVLLGSSKQP